MNADELRAAALSSRYIANDGRSAEDILEAAELYFAELDPTPVTVELVEQLGWRVTRYQDGLAVAFSPSSSAAGPTIEIQWLPYMGCDGWSIVGTDVMIPPVETMGQLRTLMRGLGITCERGA